MDHENITDPVKWLKDAVDTQILKDLEFVTSLPFDQLPLHINHESASIRAIVKKILEGPNGVI